MLRSLIQERPIILKNLPRGTPNECNKRHISPYPFYSTIYPVRKNRTLAYTLMAIYNSCEIHLFYTIAAYCKDVNPNLHF